MNRHWSKGMLLFALPLCADAQVKAPQEIYSEVLPSVVTLTVENKDGSTAIGSAFLAYQNGLAVTTWHVVGDAKKEEVRERRSLPSPAYNIYSNKQCQNKIYIQFYLMYIQLI